MINSAKDALENRQRYDAKLRKDYKEGRYIPK